MPLSYNSNTPQASQTVASTQAPILTNFQSIDSAFNTPIGGVAGGGNFTSFSFQATTTNFTLRPVNPIGVLFTVASTNGNPELAWINNVNATGAGPYNGVQLTGGGITAAVWCYFDGTTLQASYNVSSVTYLGGGNYTVAFTRNFTSAFYAISVTAEALGVGSNASGVGFVTRNVNNVTFTVRNQAGGLSNWPFSLIIFGILV